MNPFNAVCLVLNQGKEGKSLTAFRYATAESAAGTPRFQLDCLEMTRDRVTYHEARSSAWEDTKTTESTSAAYLNPNTSSPVLARNTFSGIFV